MRPDAELLRELAAVRDDIAGLAARLRLQRGRRTALVRELRSRGMTMRDLAGPAGVSDSMLARQVIAAGATPRRPDHRRTP